MSTWALVGLIALVLGIIISNIWLLKQSANSKFGSSLTNSKTASSKQDQEED